MDSNHSKKILIVEDDFSLNEALQEVLEEEGFFVLSAKNGVVGLKQAFAEHPDLILLDIIMPKMNGMTMLRKLREDKWGRDVPVIMLTNVGDTKEVMEALEHDCCNEKVLNSLDNSFLSEEGRKGLQIYLDKRLSNGVCDYYVKSNMCLKEIVARVKEIV